jgi:hypothetical protein
MSVGGLVIEVLPCERDGERRVWINTREPQSGEECAIYVAGTPAALSVSEGDKLWWQGPYAFWTPTRNPFSDHRLRRIGFSGVSRPNAGGADDAHTGGTA